MKPPAIDALLSVQSHDMRHGALDKQIAEGPRVLAGADAKIAAEKKAFEDKKTALNALERERADLRTRRRTLEDKLTKYRTQQAEVRKNDEYQALTKEIEQGEAEKGAMESEELELLFKIDEAGAALGEEKKAHEAQLAVLQDEKNRLAAQLKEFETERAAEAAAYEKARAAAPADWLKIYDQVKTQGKRGPWVVPLKDQMCGGCHIRSSSASVQNADGKPVFCGNCGRIVYVDA